MKTNVKGITALALALCLLLAACGGQEAVPFDAAPPSETEAPAAPSEAGPPSESGPAPGEASGEEEAPVSGEGNASAAPARPEDEALAEDAAPALEALEETDWQIVSTDAQAFNLEGSFRNPNFEYVFSHTDTVSLDRLIAFVLAGDAATEAACCELRDRFLEAPNAVLAYLVLIGDQVTELSGWEPMPTAEIVCQFLGSADAAFYGGTEAFAQTLAACRENYPAGRIAELLDVIEAEHAASLERNGG